MGHRLGAHCDGIDGAALAGEVTTVAAQPGPTPLRVSRDIGRVTPRAVQYMFRRHLDTTPLRYVRRLRRHYAHQDLLAAEGNQDTVTAIAVALGVHRSTVRYRRYRISELTGLDAADTRSVEALRDLANLHRRQYQAPELDAVSGCVSSDAAGVPSRTGRRMRRSFPGPPVE